MRILFIETKLTGHHRTYLLSLLSVCEDAFVVIPNGETIESFPLDRVFHVEYIKNGKRRYIHTMKTLRDISLQIKPDIIHFLYGDDFYYRFGLGLNFLYPKARVIITCHQIRRSITHDLCYRNISRISDAMVVHTVKLQKELSQICSNNIYQIEYPQFGNSPIITKDKALSELGIVNTGKKVLLAIGGTRNDKGLDILLEALNDINEQFHLIIAGKEEYYTADFINAAIETYRENVTCFLEFLSDELFALCINASDIIVLPYRRIFDGASGPLGEGVWHYKGIVGPDHKSLGELISSNHLGWTFKCEDADDLRAVLKNAISAEWRPDEKYLNYRNTLDPICFQNNYMKLYYELL